MATGRYARETTVSVDQSRSELVRTLERYGAEEHGMLTREKSVSIHFKMNGLVVEFEIPLPDKHSEEWWVTPTGNRSTSQETANRQYTQALRQRWRALNLYVKAQLEAVEVGILSFEDAFLAQIVLPGSDRTVGEVYVEELRKHAALQLPAPKEATR
jgi:hypothetical protein